MRNVKLIVSYDGTSYVGWQRQKNGLSVQELIENAVFAVTGEKVCVIASGRTDAGVHAAAQTANFKTESSVPAEKFALALNARLPDDIRVLKSEEADPGFPRGIPQRKRPIDILCTFPKRETL